MPFTAIDRRVAAVNNTLTEWQPGDYCFMEYRWMAYKWKGSPRWTTADEIFGIVLLETVRYAVMFQFKKLKALWLAWQVFFQLHVMPYELEKRAANGDI